MDQIHPLRAYRERQDPPLSQEQLADKLGTSKASVSRWETGERKPEVELVPDISAKTGIPPAELRPDLAALFASILPKRRNRERRPARAKSRAA